MVEALKPFLTGNARFLGYGATDWYERLARFAAANPHGVKISSLDRDVEKQRQLWEQALKKYGSPDAARKWVAPPGGSFHNKGSAADLQYANAEARKWAHANAGAHGLAFPLGNEAWHVEPMGQRKGYTMPAAAANAGAPPAGTFDPRSVSAGTGPKVMPAAANVEPVGMGRRPEGLFGEGGSGLGELLSGMMGGKGQGASQGTQQPVAQAMQPDDTAGMLADLAKPGQGMSAAFQNVPLVPGIGPMGKMKLLPYEQDQPGMSPADFMRLV